MFVVRKRENMHLSNQGLYFRGRVNKDIIASSSGADWRYLMEIKELSEVEDAVSCANCQACCCRLEVLLLTDTGVPEHFIATDAWGGSTMARLDDGWCKALDRSTMKCNIYEFRPWVCREFETGSYECVVERTENFIPSVVRGQ